MSPKNEHDGPKIIGVPLDSEEHELVQAQADTYNIPMSKWCAQVIRQHLGLRAGDFPIVEDE